jgi:7-carboxy-7-deazaguanine synthase
MLTVNEIFHSIQGESSYAGQPCVFVRLTACDLRCAWCDTPYAFHEGTKRSIAEVVAEVQAVETGGHRSIADLPAHVTAVMDVKCPGSGEADKHDTANFARLRPHDEVKFVIRDREDYDYARAAVDREALAGRVAAIHFSPVHGVLDPKTLAEWVLGDRLPVRVQLQVHKYIWGADVRGV